MAAMKLRVSARLTAAMAALAGGQRRVVNATVHCSLFAQSREKVRKLT